MSTSLLTVPSRGARLAVDVDGSGPVRVLLCHGGPGAPDDFADVRRLLADLGVACARFDQRGVHRSTNDDGRWGLDALVDDVEAIREALGLDRMVIFGHSWGGVVARAWARTHPGRVGGVLLASPSAAVGTDWPAMEAEVMAYLRRRVSNATWTTIGLWSLASLMPGPLGDRAMGRVYRHVLRAYTGSEVVPDWVDHSSARAARRMRRAIRTLPPDALHLLGLPESVPARAVFGDDDIYGPFVARFIDDNPDIAVTILPGCGHELWHDAPDGFSAWLKDGLRASGVPIP